MEDNTKDMETDTSNTGNKERSDYVWRGDTWYITAVPCPECGGRLSQNGKIYDCPDCDWWGETVDEEGDE